MVWMFQFLLLKGNENDDSNTKLLLFYFILKQNEFRKMFYLYKNDPEFIIWYISKNEELVIYLKISFPIILLTIGIQRRLIPFNYLILLGIKNLISLISILKKHFLSIINDNGMFYHLYCKRIPLIKQKLALH